MRTIIAIAAVFSTSILVACDEIEAGSSEHAIERGLAKFADDPATCTYHYNAIGGGVVVLPNQLVVESIDLGDRVVDGEVLRFSVTALDPNCSKIEIDQTGFWLTAQVGSDWTPKNHVLTLVSHEATGEMKGVANTGTVLQGSILIPAGETVTLSAYIDGDSPIADAIQVRLQSLFHPAGHGTNVQVSWPNFSSISQEISY
ncbi:hypothetical protein KBC55_00035 [Patescibacteria group bacterium]|nr:hypothetical protein [Patescibacteria group bacterium]